MRGLLLTGPTGVGKSTAQLRLRSEHGFWTPRTCTTRGVGTADLDFDHVPEPEFLRRAKAGDIVLPARFGSAWYGWSREELSLLRSAPGRAALNVRPYTALILQAALDDCIGVWLTLDDEELAGRRAGRREARDIDFELRARREAQDKEDLTYKACFAHVFMADDTLIDRLLELAPL